jgi:hypothetical protein
MTQSSAKNIDIDKITLKNFEGKSLEITNLVLEFSIYEDLFSQFLTAYLVMDDTNGILERLPIIGEELIEIIFRTPNEDKLKYNFATYKIENVNSTSDNAQPKSTFIINLVAPEVIVSNITSVDDSFIGYPCSYIIEKIHENYFLKSDKKYSSDNKVFLKETKLDIEDTDGNISIVSPLSSPFELIRYCVKHSRSLKYPESDFVYYQDADGFHLKTVSSLMEQKAVEDYYLGESSFSAGSGKTEIKDYQLVSQTDRIKNFDILSRQYTGMYDNSVSVIDPLLKRYQEYSTNYLNKDASFTGPNIVSKLNTADSIYAKGTGSSHSRYLTGSISTERYSEVSYLKDKIFSGDSVKDTISAYPSNRYKFLNSRISKMSQLSEGLKLNLSLPGNSNLRVGQNINFHFPQTSSDNKDQENILFGKGENSKFTITSLNHFFNILDNAYHTNVEIVKNGFGSKIERRE